MGAKTIYLASYSPKLLFPCLYGIDMSTKREFIARGRDEAEIAKELGADFVLYQTIEQMEDAVRAAGNKDLQFCKACFEGKYPTGDITERMLNDIEQDRLEAGKAERAAKPRRMAACVDHEVTIPRRLLRVTETASEHAGERLARGVDVEQIHFRARDPRAEISHERTHHPRAHHRDPVTRTGLRIPHRIQGGFHVCREHRATGRQIRRQRRHRGRGHYIA